MPNYSVGKSKMWRLQRNSFQKKKSSVKKHVSSIKHIKALENIKKSKKKDQNIKDLLAKTSGGAKGSTLPEDMRLYWYELVEALLKAGIPLLKVDSLRPFLEKYGDRLTPHSVKKIVWLSNIGRKWENVVTRFSKLNIIQSLDWLFGY